MAAPNFANIAEQWAFRNALPELIETTTKAASTGYVALEVLALTDMESDYQADMASGLEDARESLASLLDPDSVRATLDPYYFQWGETIGSTASDSDSIFVDLFDYMHTNSQSVNSRNISFGSPSAAGGNTGDGSMVRQTVDEQDYAMEGWLPLHVSETFTVECERDANQIGYPFEEVFSIKGTDAAKDSLLTTGTGLDDTTRCQSERDTLRYIKNPGFESYTATTPTSGSEQVPTAVEGWTPTGAWTNFKVSVVQLYRTPPKSSTSISLKFIADDTITQVLSTVNTTRFSRDVPYYVAVPVFRETGATGNIVITLGQTTRTVALSTLTQNAWNLVPIVATPDKSLYYENFKANDLSFSISVNTLATAFVYVDAIHMFPFQLIGGNGREGRGALGQYMVLMAGRTPWLVGDSLSFTDTPNATRAVNQVWGCAFPGYGYLPHNNAGTETVLDK